MLNSRRRTGAADEAKARLKEITREAPDFLPAWRMLAQIAFTEKQFDESLTLIENILFRDPANIEAHLLQAQVWLAKGEIKKALESLERLDTSLSGASVDPIHFGTRLLAEQQCGSGRGRLESGARGESGQPGGAITLG